MIISDGVFRDAGKEIVDLLFDTKCFREDISRDDMIVFEDLVVYSLASRYESYVKASKLFERMKKKDGRE